MTEKPGSSSKGILGFVMPVVLLGFVLLVALAFAINAGFASRNQQPQPSSQSPSPTSAPNLSPRPEGSITTANWKVYKNLEHKFTFRYPQDIFIYQSNPLNPEGQGWSNKLFEETVLELGPDGAWLATLFSNPGPIMTQRYRNIINLEVNESIPQYAVTKLSDIETGGVKGAVYFQGIPESFAGAPSYSYEAVWMKGENVYRLNLNAFSEHELKEYKRTFDSILSTFRFLD